MGFIKAYKFIYYFKTMETQELRLDVATKMQELEQGWHNNQLRDTEVVMQISLFAIRELVSGTDCMSFLTNIGINPDKVTGGTFSQQTKNEQ